jgi:hypothetical protein
MVALKTAPGGAALVGGDWLAEVRRRSPFDRAFEPQGLVDQGLVAVSVVDDCALYRLTDLGRAVLARALAPAEPVFEARAAGRAYTPRPGVLSVPCQHLGQATVPLDRRRRCTFPLTPEEARALLKCPRDQPTLPGALTCRSPSCCRFSVKGGDVRRLR